MSKVYKSINVLVICYNQQNVIKRALDSILSQREYGLNKIIVCDDCSHDATWTILQEYQSQYTNYFDIYRNEHNLGIYQNMMKLLSLRGKADLYVELSGDDAFEKEYFKSIQEFCSSCSIDFSRAIGIYSDFARVIPSGGYHVQKQNVVEKKNVNLVSLYLRQRICCRSLIVNDILLNRHEGTVFNKGLALAEWLFDLNRIKEIEDVYYVPVVGDVYYKGIGISSKLLDSNYYSTEAIAKWNHLVEKFKLESKDYLLAKAEINKAKFLLSPTLKYFIKAVLYFIGSGYPYVVSLTQLKDFLSLMKRKVLNSTR